MATLTEGLADLVQLIWLASPALPIGGFSYSEGLEAAIDAGLVHDEISAKQWLSDQLALSLARSDLPVVCLAIAALRAGNMAEVQHLDDWVRQTRESAELRLQTEQMGKSMALWQTGLGKPPLLAQPTYPIAFAQACSSTGASLAASASAFAFAWCENMVAAAIKAIPLGQNAGQRVLQHLAQHIESAVAAACARRADELQAFSPMLAVLSSQHEHQYSRLFRS